jgi:hypothetical protein
MLFGGGLALFSLGASAQVNPAPVTQPTPSVAPSNAATPAPDNPDDVVTCKYEAVTDTHFTTRICHTQREWKRETQSGHDLIDKADQGGTGQPRGG